MILSAENRDARCMVGRPDSRRAGPASERSRLATDSARSGTERRIRRSVRPHHERICADMCVLSSGVRVVLARRSVRMVLLELEVLKQNAPAFRRGRFRNYCRWS
jgi:hypothetical protein